MSSSIAPLSLVFNHENIFVSLYSTMKSVINEAKTLNKYRKQVAI